jgi:hypothetical protein
VGEVRRLVESSTLQPTLVGSTMALMGTAANLFMEMNHGSQQVEAIIEESIILGKLVQEERSRSATGFV